MFTGFLNLLPKDYNHEGRDAMEDTFAKSKVSFVVLLKKI